MGIGNTSPSSAIASVLTGAPVEEVTGLGSGSSSESLRARPSSSGRASPATSPDPSDPLDVLAKVGGTELAAMAGLMLGGASLRIPVVVDGFIAGAAAAIAVGLHPEARALLVGIHASVEPGHRLLMRHLGIPTYTNFGLRLGEGTGAGAALPIIDASVRILTEMRTLAELDNPEMMLRAALAFFTRLPVGALPPGTGLYGIMTWLPTVGMIIGLLAACALWAAMQLLPPVLCGLIGCLVWVGSPAVCTLTAWRTAETACWWRPPRPGG